MVLPHFEYCSIVWGSTYPSHIKPIILLQKRAARIILKASRYSRTAELFKQLQWLPIMDRLRYHRAVLMYKCVNGLAPQYPCSKFSTINSNYNTRSSNQLLLRVPKPNLEMYRRSLSYNGEVLWNSIPLNIQITNVAIYQRVKSLTSLTHCFIQIYVTFIVILLYITFIFKCSFVHATSRAVM